MYINDLLRRNVRQIPAKTALVFEDEAWTWSELNVAVDTAASVLASRLSKDPQQVIAILIPNGSQFIISYLAIIKLGHIALPIDVTFKKMEVDFVITASKPQLILTTRETSHLVAGPHVLVEDILRGVSDTSGSPPLLPPQQQIATLFLSSGTTGKPKAIPNTHANQLWDLEAIAEPFGWTSEDSILITLHLGHRHGLVVCFTGALYHGNTIYLESRFDPGRTLELFSSGKISLYSTVPAAYEKLVEFEPTKKFDLSKVRLFASSSSAMPPHLAKAFKDRFGKDIVDRYGTTETGSICVRKTSTSDEPGHLLKGVEARIEPNGEVAMKSPGVFPGYYHNSEATRQSTTQDGWWLTGDIGELKAGRLALRGRSKEGLQKSGYSIYPQDIEWALIKNPQVAEVKVLGVPIPGRLDDEVIVFFAGVISADKLKAYSKVNLPRSWRPDQFVKMDKIPKTANGKPSIVKLKQLLDKSGGEKLKHLS